MNDKARSDHSARRRGHKPLRVVLTALNIPHPEQKLYAEMGLACSGGLIRARRGIAQSPVREFLRGYALFLVRATAKDSDSSSPAEA